MSTTIVEEAPVTVKVGHASHDDVLVVQIDTEASIRYRVNLNDAVLWDGNPEVDSSMQDVLDQMCEIMNSNMMGNTAKYEAIYLVMRNAGLEAER